MRVAVVEGGPWQTSSLSLIGTQRLLTSHLQPVYRFWLRMMPAEQTLFCGLVTGCR